MRSETGITERLARALKIVTLRTCTTPLDREFGLRPLDDRWRMTLRMVFLTCILTPLLSVTAYTQPEATFMIRIENVSTGTTLMPSDGSMQAVPLSPGVWAVHSGSGVLFTSGQPDRGEGLEAIAEDGDPSMLAAALSGRSDVLSSGVFNTPVGATDPAAIGPGGAYEFMVTGVPGSRVSFATMFVPSNDLFYAPDEEGIALFGEDGMPVSGDVTSRVQLWDAGTEVNQEPGVGPDQVQRQAAPNTGAADPTDQVRLVNDGFTYPAVSAVIRVTITPMTTEVSSTTPELPVEFALQQNYPNPFNPETTINYRIGRPGHVELSIFNLLGQKVVDLVDEFQDTGEYRIEWNGSDRLGRQVPSGVYLYRLRAGEFHILRRMVLIR